jgi:hypothetical protein
MKENTMEIDNVSPSHELRRGRLGRRAALGLTAFGLLGGALIAGAVASNASNNPTATSPTAADLTAIVAADDPTKGGHVGANGTVEKLLIGTTADKARAAALAAVPGATIERVENDAEGATYEAHMVKSDGSHVTVKMDANFKVTGIETGPGPRPSA